MCKLKFFEKNTIKSILIDPNLYPTTEKMKLEFISMDKTEYLTIEFSNFNYCYDSINDNYLFMSQKINVIHDNKEININPNNLLLGFLMMDFIIFNDLDFYVKSLTIYTK